LQPLQGKRGAVLLVPADLLHDLVVLVSLQEAEVLAAERPRRFEMSEDLHSAGILHM